MLSSNLTSTEAAAGSVAEPYEATQSVFGRGATASSKCPPGKGCPDADVGRRSITSFISSLTASERALGRMGLLKAR